MNFDCGIYTITAPSGRQYVGSAVSFKKRWRLHLWLLRTGAHHCPPLQRAFNKYGEAALIFEKVAIVPREQLIAREQEQIDERGFKRLYNVLPIAGSPLGRKVTTAMRAKLRAALLGRQFSQESRERMRLAQTGKTQSAETRAKRSAALSRRVCAPETRAKISASQIGKARAESAGTTGVVGVHVNEGKFRAQYGKTYLGYYASVSEAAAAIEAFKQTGVIRTGRLNNQSGFRGVAPHGSRWQASVHVNGARKYLGSFDSPEAANSAIVAFKSIASDNQDDEPQKSLHCIDQNRTIG